MKKLKVVFFAFHSVTDLKYLWPKLSPQADCLWVTTNRGVYRDLQALGFGPVKFIDLSLKENGPPWLLNIFNKFYGKFIEAVGEKVIFKMLQDINPQIIITNTALQMAQYKSKNPLVMTVQAFHSVCYKHYFLQPAHMLYDLLLLPGEHHRERINKFYPGSDVVEKRAVGWPRINDLLDNPLRPEQKKSFLKNAGADSSLKTVVYAPTYNAFFDQGLFPRSFGKTVHAFEMFCKGIKSLGVNLVVKIHPLAARLIEDSRLHDIADRHDVYLAYRKSTWHLDQNAFSFLNIADVLISDVSGMAMDYLALDRPVVFIDPDNPEMSWDKADIPADLRAGVVTDSLEGVIKGVRVSLNNPLEYAPKRKEMVSKVFGSFGDDAAQKAVNAILEYYPEFCRKIEDEDLIERRNRFQSRVRGKMGGHPVVSKTGGQRPN